MKGLQCFVCCLCLGLAFIVEAAPKQGSCQGFTFPLQSDNKTVDSLLFLKVLRHNAEVYQTSSSSPGYTQLPFGDALEAVTVEARDRGRVQIRKFGDREPLGWMKREDLLCRRKP